MAPKVPAAVLEQLAKLASKLEARLGPLSTEAQQSLGRMSPDDMVALDQALEQGGKLNEVTGTGAPKYGAQGWEDTGPLWRQYDIYGDNTTTTPSTLHTYKISEQEITKAPTAAAQWGSPGQERQAAIARLRTNTALFDNFAVNERRDSRAAVNPDSKVGYWPDAWTRIENIPAIAGGVVGAGTVLASNRAEAAPPSDDGFVPDAPSDDGFVPDADGFVPDAAPQTAAPVAAQPAQQAPSQPEVTISKPSYLEGMALSAKEFGKSLVSPTQIPAGATPADAAAAVRADNLDVLRNGWQVVKHAFAPAQQFKEEHIDPILRMAQHDIHQKYLENGGQNLRDMYPVAAYTLETAAEPLMGQTEVSAPGSEHPTTVAAAQILEEHLGTTGAAAWASLAQQAGMVPFFLLPGIGKNPIMHAATAMGAQAMLEPGTDLAANVVGGAALGAGMRAVGGIAKSVGAAGMAIAEDIKLKRAEAAKPVAVIPPGAESDFVKGVTATAETSAIPSKAVPPDAAAVVVTNEGGEVQRHAVVANQETGQLNLIPLTEDAKVPADTTVLGTNEVQAAAKADINSPEGKALSGSAEMQDVLEQRAKQLSGEIKPGESDGHVLVVEPAKPAEVAKEPGKKGKAKLVSIKDRELRHDSLTSRGLAEYTTPEGQKVYVFADVGPDGLFGVAPTPDEFIPNAIPNDTLIAETSEQAQQLQKEGKFRLITKKKELDAILTASDRARQAADDAKAAQQATANVQASLAVNPPPAQPPSPTPTEVAPPKPLPMGAPPAPPSQPPGGVPNGGPTGNNNPVPVPNFATVDPNYSVKLSWLQRVGDTLTKNAIPATARGPLDAADMAARQFSLNHYTEYAKATFNKLDSFIPGFAKLDPQLQRQINTDIGRFITGDIDINKLKQLHPNVMNAAAFAHMEAEKAAMDARHQRLIDLRMITPDEAKAERLDIELEDLEDYATRVFYRFALPAGEWARMAKKDVAGYNNLLNAIYDDIYKNAKGEQFKQMGVPERRALAQRHLDLLLGDPEQLARANMDGRQAVKAMLSDAKGSLKARKDLKWYELAALGEIDDFRVVFAETKVRQQQLIARGEVMAELANNPDFSVQQVQATPEQIRDLKHVPNERKYGMMAGRLVEPAVWEMIETLPQAQKTMHTWLAGMQHALKWGRTVGNPGSWTTNFLANAQNAALSNLVNPFAFPVKIGQGMDTFFKDKAAFEALPGLLRDADPATAEARRRYETALKYGFLGSDLTRTEFKAAAADWVKILERENKLTNGKPNWADMSVQLLKDSGSKTKGWLDQKYGAIDPMWKYATYIAGLEKAGVRADGSIDMAAAEKFLRRTNRGEAVGAESFVDAATFTSPKLARIAIEKEISRRIHLAFPMLDRTAPAVNKFSGWLGWINPFIKIQAELARNYGQLPARIAHESGMAANLLGYTAVVGGGYAAVRWLREFKGINQSQVDASFMSAQPSIRRFKPGAMALWWRDEYGRPQFVDMTQMFQPFTFLAGEPTSSPVARVLQNVVMSPVQGSLFEEEAARFLANIGFGDSGMATPEMAEWKKGSADAFFQSVGKLLPGAFTNTYNTLERGGVGFATRGVKGASAPPQGAGTTAFNLLAGPNRTFAIGSPQEMSRTMQLAGQNIGNRARDIGNIGPMHEGQSTGNMTTPFDKKAAQERARQEIQDAQRQYQQYKSIIRGQ